MFDSQTQNGALRLLKAVPIAHLAREGRWDLDALRRALVTGSAVASFAVEGLGTAGLAARRPADLVRRREDLLRLMAPPLAGG